MNWRRPAAGQPRDRGAAAVEFALLLPVVLLLLFGIVDFGLALNAQITITQAAREGARLQALGVAVVPTATVVARTQAAATGLLPVPTVNTGTVCPVGAAASVDAVVTVTYTYTYLTPVAAIGKMFGSNSITPTKTLTATGRMPCET
jgi:Flp pilus assembly protein TadG